MSEQTSGLRFDVYERVHLPDDVAAIDELEEIELVPRIQVIDQGDQAVLKGQLLLSGVYRGQNPAEAPLVLEHWIPVEITLPMNRISRLDDISIDIDNFDVDLLSARTLNVTGVLSLRGISVDPVEEPEEAWREEPITVVHERSFIDSPQALEQEQELELESSIQQEEQSYIAEDETSYAAAETDDLEQRIAEAQAQALEREQELDREATVSISSSPNDSGWSSAQLFAVKGSQPQEEQRENKFASQQAGEDPWLVSSSQFVDEPNKSSEQERSEEQEREQEQEQEQEQAEEEAAFAEAYALLALEEQAQRELDAELEAQQAAQQAVQQAAQLAAQQLPEKQEPRVAFASKPPEEQKEQPANVGIMTLLQTSRREQAARQAAEEVIASQQAAEDARALSSGDEIEWKNLFLGRNAEENEFRKIRMCIVQRDETLDAIALRYNINPREILVRNNLNESSVTEGQLLYIP
ncbi:LysM peptidoglycan-binding domain-containing protein [Paenibacillus harenae]|uniref:LysM peptidoglycan-binding domain-containing protein n=1 Tax=Paenibacillus harenae TaxID=306543 RepID=UPI00278CA50A|nr:LysM peptidoglycan-binding domain-containing protein [Paenibacillus harenae]MDQ0061274.1 stage VI sporulation protein D [Paenibacillus harenae]